MKIVTEKDRLSEYFQVRLTKDQKRKVKKAERASGLSQAAILRLIISKHLDGFIQDYSPSK